MLRSQIFYSVYAIILFSSPSRGQEPATTFLETNTMLQDEILAPEEVTTLQTSSPPSAYPPLVLVGLGASAVTSLRGRERVVVVDAGHEQQATAAPLPCSRSPSPVVLEAGQTVALMGSLGNLPRPCKWLFQFQENSNQTNVEYSNLTNEGYSNLTNVEYWNLTNEGYSSLTNVKYSNLTNEEYSNLTNVEYSDLTRMEYSNQTDKDYSNVPNETGSDLHSDDSLEVTGPAGFLELICGELILVGKDEINAEPEEEEETTGKSGKKKVGGGVVGDASERFDEVKCKEGNYLVISDGRDRKERICGYLQDFTWLSETGMLRVWLRARKAGTGLGDFEMGGCFVNAI